MASDIRILLLADTHLGFDLPVRTRVARRRRGHDFLANYATALAPTLNGEVDVVVHGGDVFDRSSVAVSVAYQAFEPLRRVADSGVPVFIVPGNHERSRMPHARFAVHRNIHIFQSPRTVIVDVRGTRIALAGFPYERRNVRERFMGLLAETKYRDESTRVRLLCIHHCVEGATVGPGNYTFTSADDVIRARDLPRDVAGVFSGHIHRHQVLTTDLSRRSLDTPVLYPGSIERTSLAEIDEPKGYMVVHVAESEGDSEARWEFRQLPARPMIRKEIAVEEMNARQLESAIQAMVAESPEDAVLSIRVTGVLADEHWRALSATRLRQYVPETMNVDIRPDGRFVSAPHAPRRVNEPPPRDDQLSLQWTAHS
jgi:DNA repair exonuclease SbcCD nuclease subunit